MNLFNIGGKKALVTGSTQGIGRALAVTLARYNAQVIVHGSSNKEKCQKVVEEIELFGGNASYCIGDFLLDNCADKLYEQTGDIDILILNASIQYKKNWMDITSEEFDKQVKVNMKMTLELIQKYAPHMQKRNEGRIITVGSVQQYIPHKEMLIYAATKQAQMSIVKNLAKQLAPNGITVNNIAPGVIDTPRNTQALEDKDYLDVLVNRIPAGFIGIPEDCCGAALMLCTDAGRYITGTDIVIDGGMRL
jgi:NAD(P)-dependent dehydrogenase (short-subunit alcohol dehydrogenase family)